MSARRTTALAAVTLFSGGTLLLSAPAAHADPDVGEGCWKERGTIYCEVKDYAGNSDNYWLDESSKKGSYQSSHEEESSVTNPGGNQPPGKQ